MLPRILVVDDDPLGQIVMEKIFSEDFEVSIAKNGLEGIRSASENSPDLILLDIEMPVMNGYECIENLKKDNKTKHIPVIFVSHLSEDYNEEKGLILGAADYIIKPIRPGVMRARVKNILDIRNIKNLEREDHDVRENSSVNEKSAKKLYLKPDQIEGLKKVLNIVMIEEELFMLEDLRISQVAAAMGIKPHHLQELLNVHLNVSFIHMLNQIRIDRAKSIMDNDSEKKIIDVVYESGFHSKSVFNSAFKKITGLSPTEYK
ncbi:MAG: response regulator, partial [Spirochaetia bacterium]|nr:response regulator [Spirochaetia bacterium]